MSQDRPGSNRLLLPLVGVSALCVVEAIVIAFLLGRGGAPAPPASAPPPGAPAGSAQADSTRAGSAPGAPVAAGASPGAPTPGPVATGPAVARGRVGERVESAGLAVTVLGVTNEPRFKEVTAPPASQKFVGVEVLLGNESGAGHGYFSTAFKIKDDKDRAYTAGGLGVGDPPLEWGTIVTGEKVRGHLAFVVPREATGLTLVYLPNNAPPTYRPIHIALGQ
jgi:Domain of unknown function (DUF4352)